MIVVKRTSAAGLLTTAAILTAVALVLRLPAGASAARSAAQLPGGNVAFLSGFGGSLDVVHAGGANPDGGCTKLHRARRSGHTPGRPSAITTSPSWRRRSRVSTFNNGARTSPIALSFGR
jgi:hypothetical protein